MAFKAAGKAHRKGLTLLEVADMFRDEDAAKKWLAGQRWPDGKPKCPYCRTENVQSNIKHKTMMYRCRECPDKRMFSLKAGTVMERSNLKYRVWAVGIYLFSTNIKSISSMKLHRELGITQKSAWFMLHRLRKVFETSAEPFSGPVGVDDTYLGGKRKNTPNLKRKQLTGGGSVGKTAVVGAKGGDSNKVAAKVVDSTDQDTLQKFVTDHTEPDARVYTDAASLYKGLLRTHEAVKDAVKEYVHGQVQTNGVESFWSMLRRGHYGTYHKMSLKHLNRYVQESSGWHNVRDRDTVEQMGGVVADADMEGKHLTYRAPTADNGLSSEPRAA
ncbi:MAG: IS1595 family transposase [Bryobacterales bacterium]|nr:IS1595 family transposase [Bryobacterales bacterium]